MLLIDGSLAISLTSSRLTIGLPVSPRVDKFTSLDIDE